MYQLDQVKKYCAKHENEQRQKNESECSKFAFWFYEAEEKKLERTKS